MSALWVGYPRSYTPGRNRKPQYVALHYTAGSEGPTSAENGADYDKGRTDGTSTHYFTDSAGPALQEVPDGDRSHCALFHGNEIGIHIEICGTRQTREQWLDPTSLATLRTTAALVREICDRHGFDKRRLTTAEVRAAYYSSAKPTGITDHNGITLAYPEDGGDHTDVGADFPWDVFMEMVLEDDMGELELPQKAWLYTGSNILQAFQSGSNTVFKMNPDTGAEYEASMDPYWNVVREMPVTLTDEQLGQIAAGVATALAADPAFRQLLVDTSKQGANQAEDS